MLGVAGGGGLRLTSLARRHVELLAECVVASDAREADGVAAAAVRNPSCQRAAQLTGARAVPKRAKMGSAKALVRWW